MKVSPTFKHTMPMFNYWTDGETVSNDFIEVCMASKKLTIDSNYLRTSKEMNGIPKTFRTCFNEIYVTSPVSQFNKDYNHLLLEPQSDYDYDYRDYIKRLAEKLEDVILEWWDSNRVHMMMHSAGHDSRMVSAMLKKLERSEGKDWLGEVKFICTQPELSEFEMIMKHLGYKDDHYIKYNEKSGHVGYRRYDEETIENMALSSGFDSFFLTEMAHFKDTYPEQTWSEIDYFEATILNYLLAYPIPKKEANHLYCTNSRVNGFIDTYYNTHASRWMTTFFHRFHDYLVVGNQYEFIDLATRMPNKYKGAIELAPMDKVRRDLCEYFSKGIMQIPLGHSDGKWRTTSEYEMDLLKYLYFNSKFYERFSEYEIVRDAQPWIVDSSHIHTFDQAMLSLAGIHDRLRYMGKDIEWEGNR